jgi:YHS domain-containing protein/1,2-phenylacetyl-CoA epoxidase catalytic subunit
VAVLNRDDWYDIARDVEWTLSYVAEEDAFPAEWQGAAGIPRDAWDAWDEPVRATYRDYVATQREKDAGVYAVNEAFQRSGAFERLDAGHQAIAILHFVGRTAIEYAAVTLEARFARFAPTPRWRNLAIYGMLDEIRHTQLDLAFAHDLLRHSPQFDWAHKAYHTHEWGIVAVRHLFDDAMLGASCIDGAIATNLIVEHGFTNLRFAALAADSMAAGDVSFSNLLSSIQTDEARHAQQGCSTLEILARHDRRRAQELLDVSFWRALRLFQVITGPAMDYYTPLRHRTQSFKEFMLEWVVHHHERVLADHGLERPWYWDTFLASLEHGHHALHLGLWFWRPTLFFHPSAGVSKAERAWLRAKYPGWEASWGPLWDVIIDNVNAGRRALTYPETLPALCNLCQLALGSALDRHQVRPYLTEHAGRRYQFCSEPCQWIFERAPERYAGHHNLVERFIAGQITPMNLEGGLAYMGITPDVMGDDCHGYRWAADYRAASEPEAGTARPAREG